MHASGFVKNHHGLHQGPMVLWYYGLYRLHQGTMVLWYYGTMAWDSGTLVLTNVFRPLLSPLLGLLLSLLRAHQVWKTGENKSFIS